jgi:hypothetical protein
MCAQHNPAGFYTLLGWFGGVGSTIVGSWIASKIHLYHAHRDAHRDELKEKVLSPLRDCLEGEYQPRVRFIKPIVSVLWKPTIFKPDARSTESPKTEGNVIEIQNPWPSFKAHVDVALYQDAKANHFTGVMKEVEDFAETWHSYAENGRKWIQEISQGLIHSSGLPSFSPDLFGQNPSVVEDQLAMFVFRRVCGLDAGKLNRTSTGSSFQSLVNGSTTMATAVGTDIEAVIRAVDASILQHQAAGRSFVARTQQLDVQLEVLNAKLRLAIANTRLTGRCDLVRF